MSKKDEFTFKVVEKAENEYDSTIEMGGYKVRFTINALLDHLEYTKKQKKEAATNLELGTAQNQVAEAALPLLEELKPEDLNMVGLYCERRLKEAQYQELIATCDDTIEKYEDRLRAISMALHIDMPAFMKPEEITE